MTDTDLQAPFEIGGTSVPAGVRRKVPIPLGQSYGQDQVSLPVVVIHGRHAGPTLFVCGAIHGDELNGVEIIRRILKRVRPRRLSGTLVAVPVVNVYGFLRSERYLPDRRDLNRSFPGSPRGSLASRLAHTFMTEIVARSTHGIDLHTASNHNVNLPQIRACIDAPETEKLALAFGAPVILNATTRDGSLRQAVLDREIPMLLYEAGEALRFDEIAIRGGVRGTLSVMRTLGMLPPSQRPPSKVAPLIARASRWVRAPDGGVLRILARLGDRVEEGQTIGEISDPVGDLCVPVAATVGGIVIGRTQLPLVNEGDAIAHIAEFGRPQAAKRRIDTFEAELDPDLEDEPPREPPIA